MRSLPFVFAFVALASLCAFAACSDGVTPTCGEDAGCGIKPAPDAATSSTTP